MTGQARGDGVDDRQARGDGVDDWAQDLMHVGPAGWCTWKLDTGCTWNLLTGARGG